MTIQERDLYGASVANADDGTLITCAARGDLGAFEELAVRYYPRVHGLCARLGRPEDADDAVQDVFLRAFQHLANFRRGAEAWPWLATITKHVVIDQLRRADRELICDQETMSSIVSGRRTAESAGDVVIARDELAALRASLVAALRSIPERDRNFVWERLAEDHSFEAIASQFITTENAVRNRIWRARRVLMPVLEAAKSRWHLPVIPVLVVNAMRFMRTKLRSVAYRLQRMGEAGYYGGQASATIGSALAILLILVASVTVHDSPRDGRAKPMTSSAAEMTHPAKIPLVLAPGHKQPAPSLPPSRTSLVGKTKPHHVAPESSRFGVGIVGPDGQIIYWLDTGYQCDDNGAELMPPGSPIKAAC